MFWFFLGLETKCKDDWITHLRTSPYRNDVSRVFHTLLPCFSNLGKKKDENVVLNINPI